MKNCTVIREGEENVKTVKNKRAVIVAVAAVFVIGGVFAYWAQELLTHNSFKTAFYDTSITEEFVSPSGWLPGQETNKDVWVKNDSTIPVFVRVKIKQEWVRTENIYDVDGNEISPIKGETLPLTFDTDSGSQYAAQIQWGEDVVKLRTGTDNDFRNPAVFSLRSGKAGNGVPEVYSVSDAAGKWLILNEKPDENGELEIIYIGSVESQQKTPLLVDSVTMNPEIRQTVLRKDTRYNEETGKWETVTTVNSQTGYDCSRYTMTVTAETVQATTEAVQEVFGSGYEEIAGVLEQFSIAGNSSPEKVLSFEKKNGKMVWSSRDESGENWFMSFTDMVPGEGYTDKLKIENQSDKSYDLYMQFIPLEQSDIQDDLLEKIHMDVFFAGSMIYSGTAAGKAYGDGNADLRNVIKLCRCDPSYASDITVSLSLDKDIDIEYSDILTKIDCKFMVKENKKAPEEIIPKTGDSIQVMVLVILICVSFAAVFALIRKKE